MIVTLIVKFGFPIKNALPISIYFVHFIHDVIGYIYSLFPKKKHYNFIYVLRAISLPSFICPTSHLLYDSCHHVFKLLIYCWAISLP
jgi:hypothetical protein